MEKKGGAKYLLSCKYKGCAVFPVNIVWEWKYKRARPTEYSIDELVLSSGEKPSTKCLSIHKLSTSIKCQSGQK